MRFRQHQEAARAGSARLLWLFGLLVLALVAAVNVALALAWQLTAPGAHYPHLFFETNTFVVLLFVLGGWLVESARLREGGGPHVARLAGGRPAHASGLTPVERQERRFVHVVQEMALASRTPLPQAWVLPNDDAINAFAAGWSDDDTVIAVTRGALERLTREELQGVVAHEFSHLAHGDTRLNMRLIGMVWGLQLLHGLGLRLSQRDEQGHLPAAALFGLALRGVGSLGWVAGRLLQAAVSRQREFLADASAVQYTRQRDGLGGALRKIACQHMQRTDRLRSWSAASVAHLCLHVPAGAWASHPPLAERLRRLYGRAVAALPDAALPPPDIAELDAGDGALARLHGAAAKPAPVARHAVAAGSEAPGTWIDPTLTDPDAAQREADALQRIGHWHGPRQLQLALLALAGTPAQAWRREAGDAHFAPALWADAQALRPPARREVLALVLQRLAATTPETRQQALRLLKQHAQAPTGALLRLLACQHLRPRPAALRPATLQAQASAAQAATRLLAQAMALPPEDATRWCRAVDAQLALAAPPFSGRHALRQACRLRRLAPMQRPTLAKAWAAAAATSPQRDDVLFLACRCLDTPLPPAAAAHSPVRPRRTS